MWSMLARFFVQRGILPNGGGLLDQDLRFFIALKEIAPEMQLQFEGGMGTKANLQNFKFR